MFKKRALLLCAMVTVGIGVTHPHIKAEMEAVAAYGSFEAEREKAQRLYIEAVIKGPTVADRGGTSTWAEIDSSLGTKLVRFSGSDICQLHPNGFYYSGTHLIVPSAPTDSQRFYAWLLLKNGKIDAVVKSDGTNKVKVFGFDADKILREW